MMERDGTEWITWALPPAGIAPRDPAFFGPDHNVFSLNVLHIFHVYSIRGIILLMLF